MALEFKEPAKVTGQKGARAKWKEEAAELKAKPGMWAVIQRSDNRQMVSNIKEGRLASFKPAGSFQAKSRADPETGLFEIYVRYVGEDQEHA